MEVKKKVEEDTFLKGKFTHCTRQIVEILVNDFEFINPDVIDSRLHNITKKTHNIVFDDIHSLDIAIPPGLWCSTLTLAIRALSNKFYNDLKVTAKTGETIFIVFNVVAEKLLDTSAHKLFNKLTSASNDVPVQVQSLCGKKIIFKLKLNHYNLKEGIENFTISKLWIPDDNLEVFVDVLLTDFEDHEDELHVSNGAKSRKRRNLIIDDEELSVEDTNKVKNHFELSPSQLEQTTYLTKNQ
ncbi:hypothetical protein H5410_035799 [Solanum commersonii]|uniref:Uncharacterized protein n=1 Tax=Solanum commersonii TaxID=4109 RepID=A0A9J5Y3W2_SOLCO|nr:hypothetical protein H5410_035799 [Solanum commersonii]